MGAEEAALVERCLRGDQDAWRKLVEVYGPVILAVVRRTCGPGGEGEAEDLCSEVFRSLLEEGGARLRAYDPRYALSTWLGAIARSVALDRLRSRRAAERAERRASPPAEEDSPVERAARGEAARTVEAVLRELSPRERLVVRLFYYRGLRYREIASVLGMPVNTVSSLLFRALEKLRERLAGGAGSPGPS